MLICEARIGFQDGSVIGQSRKENSYKLGNKGRREIDSQAIDFVGLGQTDENSPFPQAMSIARAPAGSRSCPARRSSFSPLVGLQITCSRWVMS